MFPTSHAAGGQPASYILPLILVAVVVILRNARPRKLRIERLWVYPVILVVFLALALSAAPPPITPISLGLLTAGFALGVILGWQRGRFVRIDIDPETHDMTSRSSVLGIVFILAIFALRYGMDSFALRNHGLAGVPVTAVGDALATLAIGMMATQRLEMWLRATRLLAEAQAQAAKAGRVQGAPTAPKPRNDSIVS